MQSPPPLFLLLAVAAGVLGLVSINAGLRLRRTAPSRALTLAALLPGLVMLGLFFSLAVHMHKSLGDWPTSIGQRGFPSSLVTHSNVAMGYFSMLFLVSLFAWPVALLLCAFVQRWRGGLFYLGVYALSCLLCFSAMLLAPSEFLTWWQD